MHNSNTLQLSSLEAPALKAGAFSCVVALPGKVVVEMAPTPTDLNGILLPEKVGGRLRPDVGTVIACAPPRDGKGRDKAMGLKPGDGVLVRPYDGVWMKDFKSGGYVAAGEVRMYGIAGSPSLAQVTKEGDKKDRGIYELVDWSESVVAKVMGQMLVPTQGNLLIRPIDKESAIHLPSSVDVRSSEAVVMGSGDPAIRRGARVVWVTNPTMDLNIAFDEDNEGLWIIRADQVKAIVEVAA